MDNLQSITYQTFEQDPVKYRNYEEVRLEHIDMHISGLNNRHVGNLFGSERVAETGKGVRHL